MSDFHPSPPPPDMDASVGPQGTPLSRRLLAVFWNYNERRMRALWRFVVLALFMAAAGMALRATGLVPERGTRAYFVTVALANTVIGVLAVGLVGRFLDRRRFRGFGFELDRRWWQDLAFGLGLGALLMTGVFVTELTLGWVKVTGTFRTSVAGEPFAVAILVPTILFVLVGFVEELMARGYLLRNVAEGLAFRWLGGLRGGMIVACVVSSLLFALGHADNPNATWVSTANIAFAGALLALGLLLTGELAIPIGLHITWNFFQAAVFGFPVSGVSEMKTTFLATEQVGPELWTGGAFGPEAGLVGLAAMLVGAVLIVVWVRARRGAIRLATRVAEPPSTGRATVASTGPV